MYLWSKASECWALWTYKISNVQYIKKELKGRVYNFLEHLNRNMWQILQRFFSGARSKWKNSKSPVQGKIPIGIFFAQTQSLQYRGKVSLKLKVSSTGKSFRSNSKSPAQEKVSLKLKVSSTGESFCSNSKSPVQGEFSLKLKVSSTGESFCSNSKSPVQGKSRKKTWKTQSLQHRGKVEKTRKIKVSSTGAPWNAP